MEAKSDAASQRTLTISAARAVSRPVAAAVQVTGSFMAKEASDVAPQTAGRVMETPVDVGDFVKQGQVIARLDDRDAKLRLDQAHAAQQQAEASVRQAQSKIGLGLEQNIRPQHGSRSAFGQSRL